MIFSEVGVILPKFAAEIYRGSSSLWKQSAYLMVLMSESTTIVYTVVFLSVVKCSTHYCYCMTQKSSAVIIVMQSKLLDNVAFCKFVCAVSFRLTQDVVFSFV